MRQTTLLIGNLRFMQRWVMLKYPRGYSFANYEDGTFKDGGSLEDATDALANTLALLYRSSR